MCSKCVKRVTFLVCCVWSTRNLRCSLDGGADGAEFFYDSLYLPGVYWPWVWIVQISRSLRELWVKCAKSA